MPLPPELERPRDPEGTSWLLRSRQALCDLLDGTGLSERELARRAGLGHATVNHLCTGRRDTCSPPTARLIAAVLDCPPGALFTELTELTAASGTG